jgi:hypothetical protein
LPVDVPLRKGSVCNLTALCRFAAPPHSGGIAGSVCWLLIGESSGTLAGAFPNWSSVRATKPNGTCALPAKSASGFFPERHAHGEGRIVPHAVFVLDRAAATDGLRVNPSIDTGDANIAHARRALLLLPPYGDGRVG